MNIFHHYLHTNTCAEYAQPNYPHAGDQVQEGQGLSNGNVALFGQRPVDKQKEKEERGLTDVTCYGLGKRGHVRRSCSTKGNKKAKNKKGTTQRKASSRKTEATTAKKLLLGNALHSCRPRHCTHQGRTHCWLFLR